MSYFVFRLCAWSLCIGAWWRDQKVSGNNLQELVWLVINNRVYIYCKRTVFGPRHRSGQLKEPHKFGLEHVQWKLSSTSTPKVSPSIAHTALTAHRLTDMPTCENNGVSFPEFLREEPQREVHALLVQSWYAKKGGKIVVVTGNAVNNYTSKVLSLPSAKCLKLGKSLLLHVSAWSK